jgi:hypothetical protein
MMRGKSAPVEGLVVSGLSELALAPNVVPNPPRVVAAPLAIGAWTNAFADYPWTRWVVDPDDHVERLRALYAIHLDVAVRFGEVWMTDDATGVAAWTWSQAEQRQAAYLAGRGCSTAWPPSPAHAPTTPHAPAPP